jgi:protein TonB
MKHIKLVSYIILIAFVLLPSMSEAQTKNNTDEAIKVAIMALKKVQLKAEQAPQNSGQAEKEVDLSKESRSNAETETLILDDNNIYDAVEEMPQFPGGPSALFEYISKDKCYPKEAEEKGIQGRVLVAFVIEPDGSTSNVKVSKSVDPLLDKEAVRVVESMPRWIPGKQNGKVVRVRYIVPVTFRLQ